MSDFYPHDEHDDDDELIKSKTEIKREFEAMQELGSKLCQLGKKQLQRIPMDDKLAEAVAESRNIKHREGLRRHMQYIGKLMRNNDHEAIEQAYERVMGQGQEHAKALNLSEQWRERLLSDNKAVGAFIDEYQLDDIQHLRQLVRNAQKEVAQQKNQNNAKKLFRFIRETVENSMGL